MKQMSEEKKLRLDKLELLTYEVEVGKNERRPVRVENKDFENVLKNVLIAYIQSKRCKLPFNEDFACWRLSLKSWPKEYIDGFIPKDFRVQRTFLDELARMISIHVTANFLSKPHKEAA